MAKRGDLDVDPETDNSTALFVTRASVEKCRDVPRRGLEPAALLLAEVVRFTGRRVELLDLVRAGVGVLEEVPWSRCVPAHRIESPFVDDSKRLRIVALGRAWYR
ncbi:MAG: hypothetical protein ACRDYY_17740, partial [Acidimicrobiales bacterium]